MTEGWSSGNQISLLENGEQFFPRLLEAVDNAEREILIETFILRDDKVGQQVKQALLRAASKGVRIALSVDGYGSYYLPEAFIHELTDAGVVFSMYDPPPRWISFRTNLFRRLHRKLVVIDHSLAFIGGINLSYNHLCEYGPEGKQDYAAEMRGPIVYSIRQFLMEQLTHHFKVQAPFDRQREIPHASGDAAIKFVTRDNDQHHTDIENEYIKQISQAKKRVVIANAYFFPGYRLLRELRNAARRGLEVRLIIQGKPGSALAMRTAPTLYDFLVESNIEVYEYWERPLHGKVAIVDDDWSTIGSSNLDPLSLSLNLEANVVVKSTEFNHLLYQSMERLIQQSEIRKINDNWIHRRTLWKWMRSMAVFHFLRHFPAWVGWLPAHTPRIHSPAPDSPDAPTTLDNRHG